MSVYNTIDPAVLVGQNYDHLSYEQRAALAGKWIALELYTPMAAPARNIGAIGDSAAECGRQLAGRGLNPANYEYLKASPPY